MNSILIAVLAILAVASPVAAFITAMVLYDRHCERVGPGREANGCLFIVALIAGAVVGMFFGCLFGVAAACGPNAGNLCGLFGFFITGPFGAAVLIILVSLALPRR